MRPAIVARELALVGARGPVYGPVSLEVPRGWLVALVGQQGTGRTSLLLTLTGRMRFTSGTLSVLNHKLPHGRRDVQSHCAIAGFDGIDILDEGLTIGELTTERAALSVPLWRRPLRLDDPEMARLVTTAFGPEPPAWDTRVYEITPLQALQVRVLLALIGHPAILAVDNVDSILEPESQREGWRTLQRACATGLTIVASSAGTTAIPGDVSTLLLPEPGATPRHLVLEES